MAISRHSHRLTEKNTQTGTLMIASNNVTELLTLKYKIRLAFYHQAN